MKKKQVLTSILTLIMLVLVTISGYVVKNWETYFPPASFDEGTNISSEEISSLSNETFKGNQVISVNNQVPVFTQEELSLKEGMWQKFSELDSLNRVGEANAMLHNSMMPKDEREALYVNPSGWKNKKTKTGWLYNRAHLIGFQLSGENNNPKNLMTATRSLNTPCMLEYENRVADYLHETNNHVRYRVTPIFKDNELVARGVEMQAQSIEDDELQFHVYIFNIEEGMKINYTDGTSKVERTDE
ncbi:TPA: DNA/RNA non-specific endonuclease [Listeria innocua]|uniref:DNA/RNA non-specific endonuclease n=1 Tax=Listeria TaxID=1637 RepID=UPI00083D9C2E|nr:MULTISPECIES: DNA/RNA non-specific endonuclease [Listeria]EAE3728431.1 DNA-entry nuclease [Listeria monocytogenes serotype 1/2b]EAC3748345.1 DNA-entry nuclease [Listeria monocytogenes]EAC5124696.1 DNA-entry nuclease [Listeria monocytogenes]EAC5601074.1 DNA-entry nuclease [Listeria monocytogenes]EAC7705842.1 DNA-entry nuclease [Listeria monocytogenes]